MPFLPEIDLTALVQFIGYPGLFTVIFLESGVFFGFFLPGGSLLFTAGILASAGVFNIWILIPLLFSAAVLGDNAGYWFGAKVGHTLFSREDSRFFKRKHVQQTRTFFEKYGTRTILFARFVPIVRTFAPILAGVGGMKYPLFLRYNALGALFWAVGVSLAGFFLGRAIPDAEKYLPVVVVLIVITSCIPLFLEWRKQRKKAVKSSPRAVIFDLDNTLAESFEAPKPEVVERLHKLLKLVPIAIMTGASFERLQKNFLPALTRDFDATRLYLFPDTAAQCYLWKGEKWTSVYKQAFGEDQQKKIVQVFERAIAETGVLEGAPQWGEHFLARDTQVTFAALGIDASAYAKAAWDPDRTKREKLKKIIEPQLPGFDVHISARTAIDITRKGIDKAYGVRWFAKHLGVAPQDMIFVGDDFSPSGNDAVVIPTGIQTLSTSGPEETETLIDELQAVCSKAGTTPRV